jgi:predicted nucleotidyltransferase
MIDKAKALLEEIFNRYSSQGMDSVYFYGSIMRDDFNSSVSDIDSLAIVADTIPIELENKIRADLSEAMPEIKKFGFRLVYKSELSTGEVKGSLTTIISPKSLLLEIPNWQLIKGINFQREHFRSLLPTYTEALEDEVKIIRKRGWFKVESVPEIERMPLLKKLTQILYLKYKIAGNSGSFCYSDILDHFKGRPEEHVVAAIKETKQSGWASHLYKKHTGIFQEFLDKILS